MQFGDAAAERCSQQNKLLRSVLGVWPYEHRSQVREADVSDKSGNCANRLSACQSHTGQQVTVVLTEKEARSRV
eukprot:1674060-Pleurochrysis_carterae.AAC.1